MSDHCTCHRRRRIFARLVHPGHIERFLCRECYYAVLAFLKGKAAL